MSRSGEISRGDSVRLSGRFLKQFQCPACKKNLREPILTCSKGHNICKQCKGENQRTCPIGQCPFPEPGAHRLISRCATRFNSNTTLFAEVRNVALEKLVQELKLEVACKQVLQGCPFASDSRSVRKHEEDCDYRSVHCPVLNCYSSLR